MKSIIFDFFAGEINVLFYSAMYCTDKQKGDHSYFKYPLPW